MSKSEADRELAPWQALRETFKVSGDKDRIPPPTVEELDRFEAETGIKLPAGYRGYIRVFGPGCLLVGSGKTLREMFIQSPYCANKAMNLNSIVERLQSLKDDPPRGMDEQTRRIIFFGSNGLGDEFGWDPQDVTDPLAPEFGVYAWYRGDNVVKISNSFQGFIRFTLDLKARFDHKYTEGYQVDVNESDLGTLDLKPKRVFQRTQQPE